jgi:hypothetical protein
MRMSKMNENINYLRMIAPVEESNISSRNYEINIFSYERTKKYLIYNNTLYLVFKTINIGDELIENENIIPTTLMEEIEKLWAETRRIWCFC